MVNIISIKNYFELNNNLKNELIEDIFSSKKIYDQEINSPGAKNNFKVIKDRNNVCKNLYLNFLQTSKEIFGDIILDPKNSDACYSLCTNKDYWESVPHDHIETSTINAVYYVQIPKINGEYCGKILLLNDNNEWEKYQPEPFEMLIMPNYLVHDTEYHNTEEWRISLNMEIICKIKSPY
jgi:hypothetical protein